MTEKEVLESLCYYDKRNPENVAQFLDEGDILKDFDHNKDRCYCDNCFRGKTRMAEYILELYQVIEHHKKARGL